MTPSIVHIFTAQSRSIRPKRRLLYHIGYSCAPFQSSILAISFVKTLRAQTRRFCGYNKANERSCSLCATTSEFNEVRDQKHPFGCVRQGVTYR